MTETIFKIIMRFFYEFYKVRQRFDKKNVLLLLHYLTINYYKNEY